MEGNTNATKRVQKVKKLLTTVGVDPERVDFYNLSAAQGPRWAEICTEFTEKIIALGPSPIWLALKKKNAGQRDTQPA
ncbi:MAG: hydrogenase iron-sulfur subunit [Desulfobulbaceae bacterium]|nr:MAG: hydrogenase iron-sulfur subunit [Desulfobulbaceae bacterium]